MFYIYSTTSIINNLLFNGYIKVDSETNLVTGIYDFSLPLINNDFINILLPTDDPTSFEEADNIFPFGYGGSNFYSTALQTYFGVDENHFNIYDKTVLFSNHSEINAPYYIMYTSLPSYSSLYLTNDLIMTSDAASADARSASGVVVAAAAAA